MMKETKKIAIMQPYFLPYMGYWQLIRLADEFIIYDTIQYTKKGWINRNRFLKNGGSELFSIPLKKESDFLHIRDRNLAESFDRDGLLRKLENAYKKAPYFDEHFCIFVDIINHDANNLFDYIFYSIKKICDFLTIYTPVIKSSDIASLHEQEKGQDKVLNIVKARNGTDYINPIGGIELYDKKIFSSRKVDLKFIQSDVLNYKTFSEEQALPHMSILDVMMFNSRSQIIDFLSCYKWVEPHEYITI